MFNEILEMLSYPFIQRALIVGSLVSLCAALLGVTLVLKRYSMIGDGLSHVGFGALAVASVMNLAPLSVAIPVVVIAAFFLLRLSESSKLKGDSAIAVVSTASLAFGVMVLSLHGGINTDVYNYMFGSIYAISGNDAVLSIILCIVVLLIYTVFYRQIFAITFDETFSRSAGIRVNLYNMLVAALTAVTVVLGMRMMGAMLISALIIFPSLTSMRIFKTYRSVVVCSAIVSFLSFILGISVSYFFDTPGGASIVLINLAVMLLFTFISWINTKLHH